MNEANEKYLAMMLEGYEQNVLGVSDAISRLEQQIQEAEDARADMQNSIYELRELLGLSEEEASPEQVQQEDDSDQSLLGSD